MRRPQSRTRSAVAEEAHHARHSFRYSLRRTLLPRPQMLSPSSSAPPGLPPPPSSLSTLKLTAKKLPSRQICVRLVGVWMHAYICHVGRACAIITLKASCMRALVALLEAPPHCICDCSSRSRIADLSANATSLSVLTNGRSLRNRNRAQAVLR